MSSQRRSRLLQPVSKLFLMHAPFRLCRQGGAGFAPGLRASLAWTRRAVWRVLFDHERFKYWIVRLRQRFSRS